MKVANDWKDYEILSTSEGYKLERWGKFLLLRPDPQIIWRGSKSLSSYPNIAARFVRGEGKAGEWIYNAKIPDKWNINWKNLTFSVQPMNFKHTGVFPEQAVNWALLQKTILAAKRPIKVLNLFAYTGGATLACAEAGASVVHVDAAKAMVERAKENARLSNLADKPIRYIVDDCVAFVEKEARRGNKYDIIIMDPPSFGRGPNNEMWKLEDNIFDFVTKCGKILSDAPLMMMINSYTTGLQPLVMANILRLALKGADIDAYELGIPTNDNSVILPAGCTAVASFKEI